MLEMVLTYLPWIIIVVVVVALLFAMIRTAKGNEALVVSGVLATNKDGKPIIKRAGGRIVIPFIQKAQYFDLCVRTAKVEEDVTKTKSGVPIQIDWAVAYSPDASSDESLQKAVCNFLDKDEKELQRVILDIVSGGVRAVISRMTPEEVMNGKDKLDDSVKESISTQMSDLGFNAILSIHEVEDAEGSTYYKDLAAEDRETRRREAANITAKNNQQIRETEAETDQAAQEKELAAQVAVAEKQRDTDVKKAQFAAETAREQAKSEKAGELEGQEIEKALEEKRGAVAVTKQEQANLAAMKEQEVEVTKAETDKKKQIIAAEAEAEKAKTTASGEAEKAKIKAAGDAEAKKTTAAGEAEAEATKVTRAAEAEASATKTKAEASANKTRVEAEAEAAATEARGKAEAEATRAKGLAEAEAIKAKGLAEAEAERQKSEAAAANDRVNFELEKIRIEQEAQVQISTKQAEIMASLGQNATFYDFGGARRASGASGGDLLTSVLGNLPELLKKANLVGEALNGEPVTDSLKSVVAAVAEPIKGESDAAKALPDTAGGKKK